MSADPGYDSEPAHSAGVAEHFLLRAVAALGSLAAALGKLGLPRLCGLGALGFHFFDEAEQGKARFVCCERELPQLTVVPLGARVISTAVETLLAC